MDPQSPQTGGSSTTNDPELLLPEATPEELAAAAAQPTPASAPAPAPVKATVQSAEPKKPAPTDRQFINYRERVVAEKIPGEPAPKMVEITDKIPGVQTFARPVVAAVKPRPQVFSAPVPPISPIPPIVSRPPVFSPPPVASAVQTSTPPVSIPLSPIEASPEVSATPSVPATQPNFVPNVPEVVPEPIIQESVMPVMPPPVVTKTPTANKASSSMTMPDMVRSQTTPTSHHIWRWIFVTTVIVMVLVGAGAYVVYATMFAADKAVPDTMTAIDAAAAMHSDTEFAITSTNSTIGTGNLSIITDFHHPSLDTYAVASVIDLNAAQASIAGEVRFLDGVLYGKLTKGPSEYPQAKSLLNKWYSIKMATLLGLGKEYGASTSTLSYSKRTTLKSLYDKLDTAGVISTSFRGFAMNGGVPVRRYAISFDTASLTKLFETTASNVSANNTYNAQIKSGIQDVFDRLTLSPIIIDVDLMSGEARSVSWDISQVMPSQASQKANTIGLKATVALDSVNVNPVTAPADVTALDSMVMDNISNSKQKSLDARIISDIMQIRMAKETKYVSKTGYVACAADPAIGILATDIKDSGSELICRESSSAYALSAKLNSSSTSTLQYFCIDSGGFSTTTSAAPKKTSCK